MGQQWEHVPGKKASPSRSDHIQCKHKPTDNFVWWGNSRISANSTQKEEAGLLHLGIEPLQVWSSIVCWFISFTFLTLYLYLIYQLNRGRSSILITEFLRLSQIFAQYFFQTVRNQRHSIALHFLLLKRVSSRRAEIANGECRWESTPHYKTPLQVSFFRSVD